MESGKIVSGTAQAPILMIENGAEGAGRTSFLRLAEAQRLSQNWKLHIGLGGGRS